AGSLSLCRGLQLFFALIELSFSLHQHLTFFADQVLACFEEFLALAKGVFSVADLLFAALHFFLETKESIGIKDRFLALAKFFFPLGEGELSLAQPFLPLIERLLHLIEGGIGFEGERGIFR